MEFSTTLMMMAVSAVYYGYQELKKPKPQRRTGLGVFLLILGAAYLIWTFVAPTLSACVGILMTQMGMVCVIAGGLLILLGLIKLKVTKQKGDAAANIFIGLALILYGWYYYG